MSSAGPRDVWVRADAGPGIGWGHVVRIGALADELRRRGARVTWLVKDSDPAAVRHLRERFRVVRLRQDVGDKLPFPPAPGTWLLLDRYGSTARDHRKLRAAGLRVLCVDDEGSGSFASDLVVNPNYGAERLRYRVDRGTRLRAGSRYAMLRLEFRKAARPRFRARARQVLVTFGGSDPLGLGPRAARELRALDPTLEVTVVAGPSSRKTAVPPGIRVVRSADARTMRDLMARADAAVVSASSTCWELARFGVPLGVVATVGNQRAIARRLQSAGLALHLGRWSGSEERRRVSALRRLLSDPRLRRSLHRRLLRAVDGRGVERLARELLGIPSRGNAKVGASGPVGPRSGG